MKTQSGTYTRETEQKLMTGADLFIQSLVEADVETVFGYPGGAVLPIYDALHKARDSFQHILCRHEQGLIHAAEGYARVTGKPGVVIATSGPGATNLITGITDAMMDSLPVVVFTGQVSTAVIGSDAFQEADVIGLTTPITKHNYQVNDIRDLPRIVKEAFHIATTGRKGPVVVDIPKNIAQEITQEEYDTAFKLSGYQPTTKPNPLQIKRLAEQIETAEKPLLLAGAGIHAADAADELKTFAERHHLPVANTLLGLGSFPGSHELSLGMAGMHGSYCANMAIYECDLLINIGARFDDRLTGSLQHFAPHATIAHIDIDPAEIGKNIETKIPVVSDAKEALLALLATETKTKDRTTWLIETLTNKKENPFWFERSDDLISPQWLIESIYEKTGGEAVITTDVGQHQMWAAQFYQFDQPHKWVTSGGLGTMGFGLPAAIGAQLGKPKETVIAIVGDGGFQMTMQEMAVLKQYNLPIKVVIVNNEALGMVRQWQETFYEERYSSSLMTDNPDFIKLAEGFGVKGLRVAREIEVANVMEEMLAYDGPVLVDARVQKLDKVFPMVAPGKGNHEMVGVRRCRG
ncbi:biosynthetic-type acetolactate synthase large subunit [Salinicoccus jeotgali]